VTVATTRRRFGPGARSSGGPGQRACESDLSSRARRPLPPGPL